MQYASINLTLHGKCDFTIKLDGKDGANLFVLASHILTVRDFRVVDAATVLHVGQTFVRIFRHIFRNIRLVDNPVWPGRVRQMDGKLAFNFVNKLSRSMK